MRQQVEQWRRLPHPNQWHVTPETARLLQHWRQHQFSNIRPFFCQVEAVETAIWLTEVAPNAGRAGKSFLEHLANANHDANPELMRLALKLATGAGKTTVMAMLIAWHTINAVRRPGSKTFTRGFLIVTPGLTIRDRLRVLQPNDPDSYYASRELMPIRCVVSVSMLTEGWDANTVTHCSACAPSARSSLCEQVVGRALRRHPTTSMRRACSTSNMPTLGIPSTSPPSRWWRPRSRPRDSRSRRSARRDPLEIRFPRVEGYRVELPEERLTAKFNEDSVWS